MKLYAYGTCVRCGTRRFDDVQCRCGAVGLRAGKTYQFRLDSGVLSIAVPGDPVQWRMRCASDALARQQIPKVVLGFERRVAPQDAIHRGLVSDMRKGAESRTLSVAVALSAFFKEI